MNSLCPSQQDSTVSVPADVAMQELKGALQSSIVLLAGIWVAAGKALISGGNEAGVPAKPLETWRELKIAAREAIEPLVGVKKEEPNEHKAAEGTRPAKPPELEPARGRRRTKTRKIENATSEKGVGNRAKKSGTIQSRRRAPRAKAP